MLNQVPSAKRQCRSPASALRALSGKPLLDRRGFGVGCGYGSDLLSPASFSAGRHPARRVAVPSLHPKLSRCRGAACRAWPRHGQSVSHHGLTVATQEPEVRIHLPRSLLRKRSQLGAQIRTGDRSGPATGPSVICLSIVRLRSGQRSHLATFPWKVDPGVLAYFGDVSVD